MNQSITLKSLTSFVAAVLLAVPASVSAAEPKGNPANPDFTQGEAIPAGAKHDWNLGPTGLRGWMFCDQMVTTDARQIAITQVEKGSPADGVFLVGDVILGVGGKPFSYDPRTEFGRAITIAESAAVGGNLTVTRWRAGKVEEVVVKLP
ncbi:MAG: PDZ domain-containing protein, partial [Verrucomicrobia bacterium]|nr:PDZ domain-containing protein [Verrucomicrobiota bacterium]